MKAYTNKTDRIDDRKCLFGAIKADSKSRKKAIRFIAKQNIKKEI